MMRPNPKIVVFGFLFLLGTCTKAPTHTTKLSDLSAENPKESGRRLIQSTDGLHGLHTPNSATKAIIGVHGFESRGYEWVYPLIHLHNPTTAIYFYRWNWNQCPQSGADGLMKVLEQLPSKGFTEIEVLGHSYGGVISAMVAQLWKKELPLKVHLIASPLGGLSRIGKICPFPRLDSAPLPKSVSWHQWRTQHRLDGAFKALHPDPQIIEIPGASVTTLPATYRDKRLGHNWSISWVAEQLRAR